MVLFIARPARAAWAGVLRGGITMRFARTFSIFVALAFTPVLSVKASLLDLFVFGDSLSDTGNIFGISNIFLPEPVPPPPYAPAGTDDARILSNGPTWPTQLADTLGLAPPNNVFVSQTLVGGLNNFAVAGANTDATNVFSDALIGTGLQGQVALFALAGAVPPPDAWHVIWAGANDLIFSLAPVTTAPQAVDNIIAAMEGLAMSGAENFLVLNLPPLGLTPRALAFGADYSELLNGATTLFNGMLASELNGFEAGNPFVDVKLLDIEALLGPGLLDPTAFGFEGLGPCFNQDTLPPGPTGICADDFSNANDYIFWDTIHPSSAVHTIVADAVLQAEVSEPTTFLLVSLGLAGLGFAGRRRLND